MDLDAIRRFGEKVPLRVRAQLLEGLLTSYRTEVLAARPDADELVSGIEELLSTTLDIPRQRAGDIYMDSSNLYVGYDPKDQSYAVMIKIQSGKGRVLMDMTDHVGRSYGYDDLQRIAGDYWSGIADPSALLGSMTFLARNLQNSETHRLEKSGNGVNARYKVVELAVQTELAAVQQQTGLS